MTTTRTDLYTTIHKAIRQILFDLSSWEGRTDYDDAASAMRFQGRVEVALGLLREHGEHEDRETMPLLRTAAPAVHASLAEEHERLDSLAERIASAAAGLASGDVSGRIASGAVLHPLVNELVAAHLAHMAREERDANPALWSAYDDATLFAIETRIRSRIPAVRMAEWGQWLMPALTPRERERFAAARVA